ncbi:MAG: autotransporter-associated beta strand repeat-containing protein [bacterium]|nr:autotransporter-associated beta strand repeat-containing protein [Candidatus Colisoma equi]
MKALAVASVISMVGLSVWAEHDKTTRIDVWETNRVETGTIDDGYLDLRGGTWTQAGGSTYFNIQATIGSGAQLAYDNKIRKQELNVTDGEFICRRLVAGLANKDSYPALVNVSGGKLKSHYPLTTSSDNWAVAFALAPRSYVYQEVTGWTGGEYPAARLTIDGGLVSFPALMFGSTASKDYENISATRSSAQVRLCDGTLEVGACGVRTGHWDESTSYYDMNLSGGTFKFGATGEVLVDTHVSPANGGVTVEVPSSSSGSKFSKEIFGAGSLRKTGAGSLVLQAANTYTGCTEVAEGALYVTDAANDAAWTGDAFSEVAQGTEIKSWSNDSGIGSWTFGYNAELVGSQCGPKVSETLLNGHPTLAFDGKSSLFLTGNAAQPIDKSSEATLIAVVRVPTDYQGAESSDWATATVIAGTSMKEEGNLLYGLAVNAEGKIGFGTCLYSGDSEKTETIWSDAAINDGAAHVVIGTWQQGEGYTLSVDGVRKTSWNTVMKTEKTALTRFILGGSEQNKSSLFTGELAELRMIPRVVDKTQVAVLTKRLSDRYGLLAEDASPAPSMPTPTVVWSADDLPGGPGSAVSSWKVGSWDFTSTLADAILKQCGEGYVPVTAPKVAADTVNGHKLVSFNGASDALALTGNSDTPVSNADGLTLAFAVRFTGLGRGGASEKLPAVPRFFGEGCLQAESQTFGLGCLGHGKVFAGHYYLGTNNNDGYGDVRSRQAFLDDGEVHIIIATWPKVSETVVDKIHLCVDGVETTADARMRKPIFKSRVLLGASEWNTGTGGVARYVPVDVAEFRIFKNTVLSSDQIRALTTEMAEKYGTFTALDRAITGEYSKSRKVLVREGGTYGAQKDTGRFEIPAGQTIDCCGTLQGRPVVRASGALMTGDRATLAVSGLDLEDGAVIRVRPSNNDTVQPIAVNGDLCLPNGTVKIDVSSCVGNIPVGTLVTWTGTLKKFAGTQFVIVGGKSSQRVQLKESAKKITLGASGLFIVVK